MKLLNVSEKAKKLANKDLVKFMGDGFIPKQVAGSYFQKRYIYWLNKV